MGQNQTFGFLSNLWRLGSVYCMDSLQRKGNVTMTAIDHTKPAIEPKLGNKVRDIVTGFSGVASSIHHYLHGCARVGIEPTELDKEGKPRQIHIFDIHRVEVMESSPIPMAAHVAPVAAGTPPPGGPQDDPIRSTTNII